MSKRSDNFQPYYEPIRYWWFPNRCTIHIQWHLWYWSMLIPRIATSTISCGNMDDTVHCVEDRSIDISWFIFSLTFGMPVNYFELTYKGHEEAFKRWEPHFKTIKKIRAKRKKK